MFDKAKSWFFEKVNNIEKSFSQIHQETGRKIKSIKLEMKKERSQQKTQKYKGS